VDCAPLSSPFFRLPHFSFSLSLFSLALSHPFSLPLTPSPSRLFPGLRPTWLRGAWESSSPMGRACCPALWPRLQRRRQQRRQQQRLGANMREGSESAPGVPRLWARWARLTRSPRRCFRVRSRSRSRCSFRSAARWSAPGRRRRRWPCSAGRTSSATSSPGSCALVLFPACSRPLPLPLLPPRLLPPPSSHFLPISPPLLMSPAFSPPSSSLPPSSPSPRPHHAACLPSHACPPQVVPPQGQGRAYAAAGGRPCRLPPAPARLLTHQGACGQVAMQPGSLVQVRDARDTTPTSLPAWKPFSRVRAAWIQPD
jgi:hypothetical protein